MLNCRGSGFTLVSSDDPASDAGTYLLQKPKPGGARLEQRLEANTPKQTKTQE